MNTATPEAVIERFGELLAEGDIEAMVDLYEPDAAFAPQPGEMVTGRDQIRAALEGFVAIRPRMEGTIEKVLEAGDTALVANRWRLAGTAADGTAADVTAAAGWRRRGAERLVRHGTSVSESRRRSRRCGSPAPR